MSIVSREGLENQIHNAKALYVWGLASMVLLSHNDAPAVLRESHVDFGGRKQVFVGMADRLTDPKEKEEILSELHKVFLRFYIRESFELIKDYCRKTNQSDLLEIQPWYHFTRLIRNCMAHNFKWVFKKFDKSLLPITLRTLTIATDLEGKNLKMEFFNQSHAWNLHTDMSLFVKNVLK
ncbi:MAG: hypothetical protein ACRD92_00765 [Nitrosopumilaceae archaeon]